MSSKLYSESTTGVTTSAARYFSKAASPCCHLTRLTLIDQPSKLIHVPLAGDFTGALVRPRHASQPRRPKVVGNHAAKNGEHTLCQISPDIDVGAFLVLWTFA